MNNLQQDKESSENVIVGRITGVYGIQGWLKIFSYTDPMEAIVDYNPWYIRTENRKNAPWTKVKLKAGKRHAKTVIAKLEGCNDCDTAMTYIGNEISIKLEQLEELKGNDEYYWRDLLGLRVINQQGIELGRVKSLMETGANDVLVVTSGNGAAEQVVEAADAEKKHKEHLIPWTMHNAIIAVDIEQGVIEVDWDADF